MEQYYIVMDYPSSPMFFYQGDWTWDEEKIKVFDEAEVIKHFSYLVSRVKDFKDETQIYVVNKSQSRMWLRLIITRDSY